MTWSTSIEDTLKTFQVLGKTIGNWAKANVLFLNDLNINEGTGPNFTPILDGDGRNMGKLITDLVTKVFGLLPGRTRTIIQTAALDHQSPFLSPKILTPSQWCNADQRGFSSTQLAEYFRVLFHMPTMAIGKIKGAVENETRSPRSLYGLIKGFVDYIDETKVEA